MSDSLPYPSDADVLFDESMAHEFSPDDYGVDYEEMYASAPDFGPPTEMYEPARHERRGPDVTTGMIVNTLREVLAAAHLKPAEELRNMALQLRASSLVLAELPEPVRDTYVGVLEAFEFEIANLSITALVDLGDIAATSSHTEQVTQEITAMFELAQASRAARNPATKFAALAEQIQASHARRLYEEAIALIDAKATADAKMRAHQALIAPTTQVAVIRASGVATAAQLIDQHLAAASTMTGISHSSGLLTLDLAFTQPGEDLHFIAPGEQTVIAGPTGTGKSTLQYSLTRNAAQDEINWGLPDTPVILAHTEEESWVKAQAMGLFPGDAFHHLANKIVIENIGSSRRRLVEMVYDLVISAVTKSQSQGRPLSDFLPRIGFLDYIQSVSEQGENDVQANITTAELILRGFQAFNPEEMAKFSGVDFRSYSGMAWPEGIEDHRMAWVVFAQLKKPADENSMFYKGGSKNSQLSDFALEDTSDIPGWRDASGNGWAWEVRENDFRIFRQNQIMGSAKILQNATNIILLHRSRPYNNPAQKVPGPDGRRHLEDVRARLVLDKTRNGSQMLFVPMAFDIQPSGFRAQYFDLLGEKAVAEHRFQPSDSYVVSGDPLLPRRPKPSPLGGVRY